MSTTTRPRTDTLTRFDLKALRFAVLCKFWALDHVAGFTGEKAAVANDWLYQTYGLTLADVQARQDGTAQPAPAQAMPGLSRQEAHRRARAAMMDTWRATGLSRQACEEYDRVMRECGHVRTGEDCEDES